MEPIWRSLKILSQHTQTVSILYRLLPFKGGILKRSKINSCGDTRVLQYSLEAEAGY
ncbi:MAG: hypothetical protein F6K09_28000 [Merismopedia sp. SIO2A8]|nr:hypothetical protein [Merismopedia sp. SIO2A8]